MALIWTTHHAKIDGEMIDREQAHPPVELAMHPLGRALPPGRHGFKLEVRIGATSTTIPEQGIDQLIDFIGSVQGGRYVLEIEQR